MKKLKMKTLRSAAKRFKKISNNKFKHKRSNLQHILTKKSAKRKRHLKLKRKVSNKYINFVNNFFPYN